MLMFSKMYFAVLLLGSIFLLYAFIHGKRIDLDNKRALKDYVRVDTVPENILFFAERYKFNPSMFTIPADPTQPVELKENFSGKINDDGTFECEFADFMFVNQLQLLGDFAVQHDGHGNFTFYKKK